MKLYIVWDVRNDKIEYDPWSKCADPGPVPVACYDRREWAESALDVLEEFFGSRSFGDSEIREIDV